MKKPNKDTIIKYISKYNKANPYSAGAYKAAINLFRTFSSNTSYIDVFTKVCFLNDAFKTRIGDTMKVAIRTSMIKNLDSRLRSKDFSLVHDIEKYKSEKGKSFKFYSFASKYCHCHQPKSFPIFDKYVKLSLLYYRNNFADGPKFKNDDLHDYTKFIEVIDAFRTFVGSTNLDYAIIDRYLWVKGMEIEKVKNKAKNNLSK